MGSGGAKKGVDGSLWESRKISIYWAKKQTRMIYKTFKYSTYLHSPRRCPNTHTPNTQKARLSAESKKHTNTHEKNSIYTSDHHK